MASRTRSSADRFAAAGRSRRKDAETGQAPTERGRTAARTKPVRITIDLEPADYRRMRRLLDEMAARTDIPALAHSAVWRSLLRIAAPAGPPDEAEVLADPAAALVDGAELLAALAAQIRADRD